MTILEVDRNLPLRRLDSIRAAEATRTYKRKSLDCLQLGAGDSFLDVGCGSGDDVLAAAREVGANGKATGVDVDPGMIAEAWRRAAGSRFSVDFVVGEATDLPFPDRSFSATRSDRMFQHLPCPERALAEMIRVTRAGGRVQIVDADWEALVIDCAEPQIAQQVVRYMTEKSVQNGRIGRQLPALFVRAGLASLTVIPIARTFFDLALLEQVVGVRRHAEAASAAGILTMPVVEDWMADLDQRHANGQFFAAALGFIVQGRKV
jgi:ubiquinone/menaquinone biosynthesis C-methylase UbiE